MTTFCIAFYESYLEVEERPADVVPKVISLSQHCNENPIYVFPKKELRGLSTNFHIPHSYVCERFIYYQSTYFPTAG